jgi:hypothetical protein
MTSRNTLALRIGGFHLPDLVIPVTALLTIDRWILYIPGLLLDLRNPTGLTVHMRLTRSGWTTLQITPTRVVGKEAVMPLMPIISLSAPMSLYTSLPVTPMVIGERRHAQVWRHEAHLWLGVAVFWLSSLVKTNGH